MDSGHSGPGSPSAAAAGVKEGEQLESASPLDPIFWMIHPILDRLLMAKRLSGESDITFGAFGNVHPFTDTEWYEYSYYTTDEFTCLGHGAQDQALDGLPLLGTMESLADVDGDGVTNDLDDFPQDSGQTSDSDGDGFGDS